MFESSLANEVYQTEKSCTLTPSEITLLASRSTVSTSPLNVPHTASLPEMSWYRSESSFALIGLSMLNPLSLSSLTIRRVPSEHAIEYELVSCFWRDRIPHSRVSLYLLTLISGLSAFATSMSTSTSCPVFVYVSLFKWYEAVKKEFSSTFTILHIFCSNCLVASSSTAPSLVNYSTMLLVITLF